MFIVFEGIDGSGKTTISNRVAKRLRDSGRSVAHVREGGNFTSSAAQAIRELGRDVRNLMLSPMAELLIYLARDGQSLEEMVLPALDQADVVISDRFLYSAQLMATAGRGLSPAIVDSIVGPFMARIKPDMAILVDVPPDVARARRRVSKILTPDDRPSSRKGLAGGGLQVRMHRAHRELADRHPETWLVVENDDADLDDIVIALSSAIETALRAGVAAGLAEGRRRLPRRSAAGPSLETAAQAHDAFMSWVDRRAEREPDLAAYVLAGHTDEAAYTRRAALASRSPQVVAHGLAGLDEPEAWRLRAQLAEVAPQGVARSLGGLTCAEAFRWRRTLSSVVPDAVASSLNGLDDHDAWILRAILREAAPHGVSGSVGGLQSARAEAERRRWLDENADGPRTFAAAKAGARMVTGCSDDIAWSIRELAFERAPADAIASLRGDDTARAWRWRQRYASRAPRPVAESLTDMIHPEAWRLRSVLAADCREVFQSMIGLDGEQAWELRLHHANVWPSTVCKSIGALAHTTRGTALLATLLRSHRGVSLLRNAAKIDQLARRASLHAPIAAPRERLRAGLMS